jgi:hypothetical protein
LVRLSSGNHGRNDTPFTGLPHGGTIVPKTLNSNDWIQFLTGGTSTNNSKGLLINKVTELKGKMDLHYHISMLHVAGQASNIKFTMLEPIGQILQVGTNLTGKTSHVTIKSNCREFQENGQAIKFPSLLIWISMGQFIPVGEPTFTIKQIPTMENYRVFSLGEVGSSDSLPVDEMFRSWVTNLKMHLTDGGSNIKFNGNCHQTPTLSSVLIALLV